MNFKNYYNIKFFNELIIESYNNQNTDSIDIFIEKLCRSFPEIESHADLIKKIIINSGCKKIEFKK